MDGWLIAFILLCVFYGPVYLFVAILGFAASIAPGTSASMPFGLYIFLLLLLGLPFIFTGYMALRQKSVEN
jgi:pilus assembly protein TadC